VRHSSVTIKAAENERAASRARLGVWFEQRRAEWSCAAVLALRVVPAVRRARRSGTAAWVAWLERHAKRNPEGLWCELGAERLTFAQGFDRVRRLAQVLSAKGVRSGDVVALVGGNSPDYLVALLGIAYSGGVAALINPELQGTPLAHALSVAAPRLSLVEAECADNLRRLEDPTRSGELVVFDSTASREAVARALPLEHPRADPAGDFVFIFTSGTTGLPKPCRVSHVRARSAATLFGSVAFRFRRGDKLYCPLPLHHSSALLIGVGAALVAGVPVALRRRFSAREFDADVARYGATATLYIGELCRALVRTPVPEGGVPQALRVAVGNGLDSEIWAEFQRRLGGAQIREFYASTEAPSAILNLTGEPGSLGHVPFERARGFRLVRLDAERVAIARGADGFASECAADEPGELLLRVEPNPDEPLGAFRGYTDAAASAARVVQNVFESGDAYFR